jgi:hypothetical protein
MWFLVLLTFANASLDQKGIILKNRINIGSLPINLLDGLLALGVIAAVVVLFFSKKREETGQTHPAFLVTLFFFLLATLSGAIGGMMGGATIYRFANDLRNVTAFPLSMFACYFLLKRPRSAYIYSYVFVISGIFTATLICVYFLGKTAEEGSRLEVEQVRAIQYVSWYAGLGAALLLYTALNRGVRLFAMPITILIIAFCLIGQFGTLSRSDWISAIGALFTLPFLLPRHRRGLRIAGFVLAIPVLFLVLWGGAAVGSIILNRDLTSHMSRRITTLLPGRGDDEYDSRKAWDTRVPGMKKEFAYFLQSPLMGQGFDYTAAVVADGGDVAFYHNVWIAQAALMGIFGFAAYFTPVVAIIVVGRRMVRDAFDKGSILVGVLGATTGVYCLIIGAATMSFNVQRGALAIGPIVAIVLRTRAMQLKAMREREYAGYMDEQIGIDEGSAYHPYGWGRTA